MDASLTYDDALIRRVLTEVRTIALVGASARPDRPSFQVMRFLLDHGYHVVPVNPGLEGTQILGQPCFSSIDRLDEPVDMADIFRRSDAAGRVVDQALSLTRPPRVIWMQLGVRNDAAAAKAMDAGLKVIMDRCPKIEYSRLFGSTELPGGNPVHPPEDKGATDDE